VLTGRDLERSTITMASAPSGIGAPVMIRIASPSPTATVGAWPAASSPTTRSRTGFASLAPTVSTACTAYPSIAVLANGGTASGAVILSASTRPSASPSSPTPMGSSRGTTPKIAACTSPSAIN